MLSAEAGKVLIETIHPILKATIPRVVRPLPGETYDDLISDGIGEAAKALVSLEAREKPLMGNSVAYYSIQRLKGGRRMLDCGITDIYSSQRRRADDGIISLDFTYDLGGGEEETLEDFLPAAQLDPSEAVNFKLGLEDVTRCLNAQQVAVFKAIAEGESLTATARKLGVSSPRITHIKKEISKKIRDVMGADILDEVAAESHWHADIRCQRERKAAKLDSAWGVESGETVGMGAEA